MTFSAEIGHSSLGMRSQSPEITQPQRPPAPHSPRAIQLARWISILAHPFVTGMATVTVAAYRLAPPRAAVRTIATFLLLAVVPVLVLSLYQVRRGAWTNVDASNKRERPVLFAAGILICFVLLGWFAMASPNPVLLRSAIVTLGMLIVCAIITRWSKVSLHVAFAAFGATTLILFGAAAGWIIALVVPALAWSRLVMGRHRPLELLLGAAIGVAAGFAIHFR